MNNIGGRGEPCMSCGQPNFDSTYYEERDIHDWLRKMGVTDGRQVTAATKLVWNKSRNSWRLCNECLNLICTSGPVEKPGKRSPDRHTAIRKSEWRSFTCYICNDVVVRVTDRYCLYSFSHTIPNPVCCVCYSRRSRYKKRLKNLINILNPKASGLLDLLMIPAAQYQSKANCSQEGCCITSSFLDFEKNLRYCQDHFYMENPTFPLASTLPPTLEALANAAQIAPIQMTHEELITCTYTLAPLDANEQFAFTLDAWKSEDYDLLPF